MALHVCINVSDPVNGGATAINWLLDHGARISAIGVCSAGQKAALEKRIDEHLKRIARDGKAYEKIRSRFVWASSSSMSPTDPYNLFMSFWKKKVIGITGKYGKPTVAIWSAHLIGDAVAAGHMPEKPILSAIDSRARIAIVELRDKVKDSSKIATVCTDGLSDLDAAIEVARYAGVAEELIQSRIATLPQIPFRQEVFHKSARLTIINDALAAEPVHGIATLERFGGPGCVFITGGMDHKLDYSLWAEIVKERIRKSDIVLLEGSATQKMRLALGSWGKGIRAYPSLQKAVRAALARSKLFIKSTILFSPSAKNLEFFDNEYDCGRQFNDLINAWIKH